MQSRGMEVRVLGGLEVLLEGRAVDLGGPKPRELLGLLVAAEGRPIPVERLIDQIWGDHPPARVEASLQSYVARLRRALEPHRDPRDPARALRTHAGGYSLDVDDAAVDARRFVDLLRQARARSAGDPDRLPLLEDALSLCRGTAYAGTSSPALEAEATRLEELRLGALEEVWELRLGRGEHVEAVAELEQLVRLHPLREQLWALLARSLYRGARQGDALAAVRRAREHLADELGVDPGPELRRLEEALLRQDPDLDLAPAAVEVSAGPVSSPASPPAPSPAPSSAPSLAQPSPPDVFGRDAALGVLDGVLDDAVAGAGRVVVLGGEPGVGKTALADSVVRTALERGFCIGRGGWDDEGCPPLWAWSRAVTQLAGSAAVLDVDGADATTASFRQGEALLAAARGLPGPGLLVLDDIHWADPDSLRLLRRVGAEVGHAPLVVVAPVRDTDAVARPQLAEVLAALARSGAVRLDLGGLDPGSVRTWVAAQTGVELTPAMADRIVTRTGGNPFYVTELVRLLVAEGALADPDAPAWEAVPSGVRDVVRHRLAQLSDEAAGVVRTAATVGRTFDHGLVAVAAQLPLESVEDAVETLQVLGLVEDAGPGRSRFSHALVRDAVHDGLTGTARSRNHAAVAAAMEQRHLGHVAEHAAELAEHYRLAGPAHARSGWVFAAQAARHAAGRSAHDEALRQWTVALELQAQDPAATAPEREELLLGQARALIGVARTLDSWAPVAEAASSALARDDVLAAAAALLTVTEDLVWGWRLHPFYDQAGIDLWAAVRDGLIEAGADRYLLARVTGGLAFECFFKPGLEEESTRLAEEAVRLAREATNDPRERLDVIQLALAALHRSELLERRLPLAAEFVDLATKVGDPARLSAALVMRAADLGELGRLEEARSDVVRAHDLAERHRLSQNLMITGWARSLLLQVEARWDEAERALDELDAFESTLSVSGTSIGLGQRAVMRELQGRLPELREVLEGYVDFHPVFREMYALAVIRSGEPDQARRWLGPYAEQPPVPRDYLWTTITALRSWVWTALGDGEAAADLHARLEPYADRLVYGSGTVVFLGSVQHWLGELAAVAGDREAARRHLEAALDVHHRLGLPFWEARTRAALDRLG